MDIFGAIILPTTGFSCVYVVTWSIPSYIEVICLHIFDSCYLSQTSQGQALCLSSLNSHHHYSTWCTNRVLTRCMFKQNCFSSLILFVNELLRASELWLLQLSSENSKTFLFVDFHKAIKCHAQKTCVCDKNALLLPSLIKASSDTGHEHENKWTKWINACVSEGCSSLNREYRNKSAQHLVNGKWGTSHTKHSLTYL